MRYGVIMAGGAGRRLWPLSRSSRPKQLLPLIDGENLLGMAVDRLEGLFDKQNIYIVTSDKYIDQAAEALPQIPRKNLLGEPEGRDTANAIALATAVLNAKDKDATMAVFTADHVIRPQNCFARAVESACETAEKNPDALVTFGIRPTWPHTGLGYIHCGDRVDKQALKVVGFKEKPDHQTARRYVDSGQYYWNSGMFVWKVSAIAKAIEEFLPDSAGKLAAVGEAARADKDFSGILENVYPSLKKISIDYAIMEKAPKVLMVELNCEWLDVGSWPALEDVAELDEADNVVIAPNAVVVDSYRNIIVTEGDHLLAVMGMDDCIVVHSPDATLVCNKSDSERLKELVDKIAARYGQKYV